jgi:uncharacterized repeat protein (TIGR01451 family)
MTGRFLNQEPNGLVEGVNLYLYARNDPVSLIDPTGGTSYNVGDGGAMKSPNLPQIPYEKPPGFTLPPGGPKYPEPVDLSKPFDDYRLPFRESEFDKRIRAEYKLFLFVARLGCAACLGKKAIIGLIASGPIPDPCDLIFKPLEELAEPPFSDPVYEHDHQKTHVLTSGDPNDKLAPGGYGSPAFIATGGTLAYEVMFENKPEATAPVTRVIVTDILDPSVDLNSLELTGIAFGDQYISVPAGLSHYEATLSVKGGMNDIHVEVNAALDFASGTLSLSLTAIDPATGWWPEDPLLGMLYPEDGTGRGQGSINYVVKPRADLPSGTRIENRARIYFDYNDPIDTPLVFNTLDSGLPVSSVAALPPDSPRSFLVDWLSNDDPGGSGVASVDVYLVADGTNTMPWLQGANGSSGWFTGEPGHSYAFFSGR